MTADTRAKLRAIPSLTGTPYEIVLENLPTQPHELFLRWLDEALERGVPEPLAATVATVGQDGVPDARTLILKDVDAHGWAFAGTASSRKGEQLAARPKAALNFWWQPVMRAIRVRGEVVEASAEETAADLAARSESARVGVQPGDWRVWRVRPTRVEFWVGSAERHHLRVVYDHAPDWQTTVVR